MAKDRRSKDQKRRAKIRERINQFKDQLVTPYEGQNIVGRNGPGRFSILS